MYVTTYSENENLKSRWSYEDATDIDKFYSYFLFYILSFFLTEFVRKPCIDAKLIPTLCDILNHDDADVAIQTCRALGNICCDYGRYCNCQL